MTDDAADNLDLLQGTLDVLILKTLSWGPRHGYAIARWIHDVSDDVLRVEEGALYPALHRLEKRGLVRSTWGISENNRQARFYEITPAGRRELAAESSSLQEYAALLGQVLAAGPEGSGGVA